MSVPDDEVSVEVEGVTVRKTVNDHQFETLAVVFDVHSDRGDAVDVSMRDAIPGSIVEDDIGFHPEYGGEHWRAASGSVTFSRTFGPGEQFTTVYGVRDFDGDRDDLLEEPSVEVEAGGEDQPGDVDDVEEAAGSVSAIDDLVSDDDNDPVRDVIAGDADSLPGMEAGTSADATGAGEGVAAAPEPQAASPEEPATTGVPGPDEADVGEAEAPEPAPAEDVPAEAGADAEVGSPAAEEPDAARAEPTAGEGAAEDEVTVPVTGGIARVLAKELRAGNVSYEDRRLLREELLPDEGSTDARIQKLQGEVADLTAYTGALEAFLDEEGGAEAVLAEHRDEIDELADDVADVETTVDGVAADVGDLEADLDSVSTDVDDVAGRLDDVERDVGAVEDGLERLDAVERSIERLEDDVDAIHDELADLAAFRDRLSSVFGTGGGVESGGESGTAGAPDVEGDEDPDGDDRGHTTGGGRSDG